MDTEFDILFRVICLIATTAFFAWTAMALPMKIAPRASLRFSLANLLLLLGIILLIQRSNAPSYLFWPLADLIIVCAFLITQDGIENLFKLKPNNKEKIGILTIMSIVLLNVGPEPENVRIFAIVFSFITGWIFLRISQQIFSALQSIHNKFVSVFLSFPFIFGALFLLYRSIFFLIYTDGEISVSSSHDIDRSTVIPTIWALTILVLFINVSLFGCTLERLVAKISSYARIDTLTGLANRRAFTERFDQECAQHKRFNRDFSLILFDLDNFKLVNDKFGHNIGDQVLQHVASVLSQQLRDIDLLARYGGEEFIVLLHDISVAQMQITAERLRRKLEEQPLDRISGKIFQTASFGVALYRKDEGEQIIKRVDDALYEAKTKGRNRVELARELIS